MSIIQSNYDVRPRLIDVRDIMIKYDRFSCNDQENKYRFLLYNAICNMTELSREGLTRALQELHQNRGIRIKPGSTVEFGNSSTWEMWREVWRGNYALYMTIYIDKKR